MPPETSMTLAAVAPLAAHLGRPLTIVDVGCRWGIADAWAAFGPAATVVGFDPDADECARLRSAYNGPCRVDFVAAALGAAAGAATLHLTREPACSSLYEPDPAVIATVPELACATPVGAISVELRRLDDCLGELGLSAVDFLKLDTQGSELDILRGADRALAGARLVEVEVEFNPIYRGQPLFGDVDRFLRDRGFVLWRLGHLVHYRPVGLPDAELAERYYFDSSPVDFAAGGGQIYWGHALFARATEARGDWGDDWRGPAASACMAGAAGLADLAAAAVAAARKRATGEVAAALDVAAGRLADGRWPRR